ncbi:MAG: beta-propeller domain-containing protein [Polyangiales bacterium]
MINGLERRLGALLLLGAIGCEGAPLPHDDHEDGNVLAQQLADEVTRGAEAEQPLRPLTPVLTCAGLLGQLKDDAIAKLHMTVEQARPGQQGGGAPSVESDSDESLSDVPRTAAPRAPSANGGIASRPSTSPTSASTTNTQVAGVDEADFVKVVDNGKAMFLLHGSTLRRLRSWPPAETDLVGKALLIEGTPSEMFVTDAGRAVVFSTVSGYGGSRGGRTLKITVADVSGTDPKAERELYFEGAYVSSRRYHDQGSDLVRVVVSASLKYGGVNLPGIQYTDPWGRRYDDKEINAQLDDWERRVGTAIRDTTLTHWLPDAYEVRDGKLARLPPNCEGNAMYFVPPVGVAAYGVTQLLSIDVSSAGQPVRGINVLGGSSIVYSNEKRMVLAQPDYRWSRHGGPNREQTALHVFDLDGALTKYAASGWVPGRLPVANAQFGLDVAADGTVRAATSGTVRTLARDARTGSSYWQYATENQVITARPDAGRLARIGTSPKLGHEDERVQSARFLGDRAYVVTYRDKDPLIVVDVSRAEAPTVLGEIEIPGFSEYIHPLDDTHLITVGHSGTGGMQLQLFDVTNPKQIPLPKLLDFGRGTSSAVSGSHKAFTMFDGILAVPIAGYASQGARRGYFATLQLAKVDAQAGFTALGSVDHASLYADNGAGILCGFCDRSGCFDYSCPYAAEVRRGHFVKSDDKTYVYSFSNAGVLVNDLTQLSPHVARVGLPAPIASSGPWYELPPKAPTEALPEVLTKPTAPPVSTPPSLPPADVDVVPQ